MDCTPNCKLKSHGNYLTSLVTNGDLDEIQKAIKIKCANPYKVLDQFGRNILHVAAACGRVDILESVFEENSSKVIFQCKDKESGWTPLHRALYYGRIDCAVFLYKLLKTWRPFDYEGISPLDLVTLGSPRLHKKRKKKIKLGMVVLPFEAETPSELTLCIGDIIEMALHSTGLRGWSSGINQATGGRGCFPTHFVEEIKEEIKIEEVWYEPKSTLHMWGNNINFTLGLGDSKTRNNAELNETLYHSNQSIVDVAITKFHTVILTDTGSVFTCGHGHGGRLGHGSEETILYPKYIESLKCYHCVAITASNQHTVVLTEMGEVLTFGLNNFNQLGQMPVPESCTNPGHVYGNSLKGKKIVGVAASRFHTVIHTDQEIYTFGTNGGQMGFLKTDETISTPKQISRLLRNQATIAKVEASDGATLCLFNDGELYILQDFICRKIKDIFNVTPGVVIRLTGGTLHLKKPELDKPEPLQIAVLQTSGQVFIYRSGCKSFKECSWQGCKLPAYSKIVDIALGKYLMIITDSGQLYFGHYSNKIRTKKEDGDHVTPSLPPKVSGAGKVEVLSGSYSLNQLYDKVKLKRLGFENIQLERVPLIHRSLKCFCDPKSRTFATIQYDCRVEMKQRPKVSPSNLHKDLTSLLQDTSIHDLILKTKKRDFFVHKFMLQCRLGHQAYSQIFQEQFLDNQSSISTVVLEGFSEEKLTEWLKHVYHGDVDTVDHLTPSDVAYEANDSLFSVETNDDDLEFARNMTMLSSLDLEDPCDDSIDFLNDNALSSVSPKPPNNNKHNKKKNKHGSKSAFTVYKERSAVNKTSHNKKSKEQKKKCTILSLGSWEDHSDVADTVIESEDQELLYCHKCILSCRSEYFRNMLNYGWMESSSSGSGTVKIPVPGDILRVVIDFLYTGTARRVQEINDITFIGEVLVCADQLLIERLKELCELCLANKVNLKNAVDLFQFSCLYQANQLKSFTCDYLSLNLGYYLEARSLENLSFEDLKILSDRYRQMVRDMDNRNISPSYLHQQMDKEEQNLHNAFLADINKFKTRRKRISSHSDSKMKSDACGEDLKVTEIKEEQEQNMRVNEGQSVSSKDVSQRLQKNENSVAKSPWGSSGKPPAPVGISTPSREEIEPKKKQSTPSPFKKKSQRERRREASQSKEANPEHSQLEQPKENICPWGKPTITPSPVTSFKDLLSEEVHPTLNEQNNISPSKKSNKKTPTKFKRKINLEDLGTKTFEQQSVQKKAWSTLPSKNTSDHEEILPVVVKKKEEFSNIIQVQTEEKQQQIKDSKKPLTVIQLEERAIDELKSFYEQKAKDGETITVKRLKRIENAIPFWDRVLH